MRGHFGTRMRRKCNLAYDPLFWEVRAHNTDVRAGMDTGRLSTDFKSASPKQGGTPSTGVIIADLRRKSSIFSGHRRGAKQSSTGTCVDPRDERISVMLQCQLRE